MSANGPAHGGLPRRSSDLRCARGVRSRNEEAKFVATQENIKDEQGTDAGAGVGKDAGKV